MCISRKEFDFRLLLLEEDFGLPRGGDCIGLGPALRLLEQQRR